MGILKRKAVAPAPDHWAGDRSKHTKVQVPESVMKSIQKMMDGTRKDVITRDRFTRGTGEAEICHYEVINTVRNQNPKLWGKYMQKRSKCMKEFNSKTVIPDTASLKYLKSDSDAKAVTAKKSTTTSKTPPASKEGLQWRVNEMLLFHGTTPEAAESICAGGFKLSRADTDSLFGPGIYMAENSSKADEYVTEGKHAGVYVMLLCRVLMGNVLYNSDMRPKTAELLKQVHTGRYHSVLGDREKVRGTYREFITYDVDHVYPEYVVYYRRHKVDKKEDHSNFVKPSKSMH